MHEDPHRAQRRRAFVNAAARVLAIARNAGVELPAEGQAVAVSRPSHPVRLPTLQPVDDADLAFVDDDGDPA